MGILRQVFWRRRSMMRKIGDALLFIFVVFVFVPVFFVMSFFDSWLPYQPWFRKKG